MAPNPTIMGAVEQLGYRVTVGDVAAQSGLNINLTQQGLLALASDAGGHLQVADTGEIVYLFPQNFRTILRNKFLRLRLKEWWEKIWKVLFYIIRISFGVILIASMILIFVSITLILLSLNSSDNNNSSSSSSSRSNHSSGSSWFGWDWVWFFSPNYERRYRNYSSSVPEERQMNFLEAIFSFLFGDGNPNADLEERRWQDIATVIQNNQGAVVAEQIAPYLDDLGTGYSREYEDYMLPVLSRFNGIPQVSPDGEIVYHFPELQTTVQQRNAQIVEAYLRERPWRFSNASGWQIGLAIGLGLINFIGAIALGTLLTPQTVAELGGLIAFVNSIYALLLVYGGGFLGIPLVRYFWIKWKNAQVTQINNHRQDRAIALNQADPPLLKKIAYAHQFAAKKIINQENLAYTTETGLIEQEVNQSAKIDAEWQRRLEQGGS